MRKEIFKFLVLLFVAMGAGPVGAAVWQWSTTAGTNATADPSINWAENMAPSSVNDSARAMMAAIAKWNYDTSGTVSAAGTTSAITLASNSGFSALADLNGQRLTFFYNLGSNAAGATLNVDSTGAQPIYENGAPITVDRLQTGGIYTVTYYSSVSRYYLHAVYNSPYNVPLGGVVWTTISTPPNANFITAAGQCISNTTYSVYWAAIGSPASGACAGGQFAIIDLRGRTVAGLDTLPGSSAAGRLTSDANGCGTTFTTMGAVCANGTQSWTLTQAQMPVHYHAAGIYDPGHTHSYNQPAVVVAGTPNTTIYGTITGGTTGSSATGVRVNSSNGLDTTYSAGSGTAHPSVQPTMGLYPWLRVL